MASIRNCARMSRPRAPTAMRRPISRVRSVTLTSMMFMMPMPPITRLIPATVASSSVMTRLDSSWARSISVRLRTLNGSSAPGCTLKRWRKSSLIRSSTAPMSCPSRTFTEIEPTRFKRLVASPPHTRLRKVPKGSITTSSWSCPMEFWPLGLSTPTTVMGMPRNRTVCSTGSWSPNNSRATVAPSHTTLAEPANSAVSNTRPLRSGQSRASW